MISRDQFGHWHTQWHSEKYDAQDKGGDYYQVGGGSTPNPTPNPTPTPTPAPTPAPTPTPTPDPGDTGVVDSEVDDGAVVNVGDDNAGVGGNNDITDIFNSDKEFTVDSGGGDIWNWGNLGSDLSVNLTSRYV